MTSRKHYEQVAAILRESEVRTHPDEYRSLVAAFAQMLGKDNPRFDVDRFYAACGL